MPSYFPLDRDILTSSLWAQGSPAALKVFLYMLLRADPRTGVVSDSDPGIALHCGLVEDVTDEALKWLSSPDPKSRSETDNGARIKKDEGRWVIVNHSAYKAKNYSTPRVQRWREKNRNSSVTPVTPVTESYTGTTNKNKDKNTETESTPVESELVPLSHIEAPPQEEQHPVVEGERAVSIWMAVLEKLRETVPDHNYATWLRPTRVLGESIHLETHEPVVVVEVPNEEFRAHIWGTYGARIRGALEIIGSTSQPARRWQLRIVVAKGEGE